MSKVFRHNYFFKFFAFLTFAFLPLFFYSKYLSAMEMERTEENTNLVTCLICREDITSGENFVVLPCFFLTGLTRFNISSVL